MKVVAIDKRRTERLLKMFAEIKQMRDEEMAEDIIKLEDVKPKDPPEDNQFADVIEANRQLKARKAKERLEANKSVLRSYRIKG